MRGQRKIKLDRQAKLKRWKPLMIQLHTQREGWKYYIKFDVGFKISGAVK